ncbi:hypothetical protein B566_EDAN005012 [Ephemera danica]|nr:hypothetical protein B566_EDAN005012 [Ephemera danica]
MDGAPQCMRRCRSHVHGATIGAAIIRGSEEEAVAYIKWLCSNCAQVTDQCGRTALHVAASKGRRRVAEWLIKHRDAILNLRDQESGYTALHRSIFYGQIHVAVSLIKVMQTSNSVCVLEFSTGFCFNTMQHAMKSRLPIVEFSRNDPCEAYVWGTNANFNLGLGNQQSRSTPELMDFFRRSAINIKQASNIYQKIDAGKVFSCGHGQGGRLGQDSEKPSLLPQPMKLAATEFCIQASISTDHTVLLMENGTYHQLGHNATLKMLCSPRALPHHALPANKVLGVCAGRFHTVIWSQNGVRTCGLNAGQLGHPKGEATYPVPKQVQALQHQDCHITHVASSDAATVVVMKKGTIMVLHEHRCRTIASRMLHVKQVVVSGGHLASDVEQSSEELRVCLMIWQQSTQQLTKWLKRLLIVTDVAMTNQQLLFTTVDGEAFEGFIQPHKKSDCSVKGSHDDEWEFIRVRFLPNVHRAVGVSCDPRGRNFAVVQAHPKTALLEVPQVETSNMREQMATLLKEVCEEDAIHDVIFSVGSRRFATHTCIVGAQSEVLAQLIAESCVASNAEDAPVVKIENVKPEIFEQFLQFIYTNQCNLLVPGPFIQEKPKLGGKKKKKKEEEMEMEDELILNPETTSAFQVYHQEAGRKGKTNKWKGENKPNNNVNDPLRDVAASARKLGLLSLSKALDTVQYRLAGRNSTMNMALPIDVLEVLLGFLYTDEAPQVSEDPELARTMLVVADQMFIDRLKETCECALASTLTLRNAAELLQLAATYNAEQLKVCCMQYISINLSAFLEARSLEEVEWPVLEDLAKYYRELTPAMWSRTLTPYSESPSNEELESVAASFPVDLDQDCDPDELRELLESKKVKAKKQKKVRRSSGEQWRVRKESVSSNASDGSEDPEPAVPQVPLRESREEITLSRVAAVPAPPVELPVSATAAEERRKKWNSMFPDLNAILAADTAEVKMQKLSDKKAVAKLSQRERKRLVMEQPQNSPTSPQTVTRGVQQLQISSPSLPDVMKTEKVRGNPWNISAAIAIPGTKPSVSSPQSPPESAWKFPASPVSPVSHPAGNLDAIVADELQQRKNLQRVRTKPLVLTQMEDKAIAELLTFYNAHNSSDERITVLRVESGAVATPTWVSSHR